MPLSPSAAFGADSTTLTQLLQVAGYYWHSIYPDQVNLQAVFQAIRQDIRQQTRRINDHADSLRPSTMPLARVETFYPVNVPIDSIDLAPIKFGDGYTFGQSLGGGKIFFGQKEESRWLIPLPNNVISAAAVQDRPYRPTQCLVNGSQAFFTSHPDGSRYIEVDFDPLSLFDSVTTTDGTSIRIWLYMAEIDELSLYRRFGILLGKLTPSLPGAQTMVDAVWDAYRRGSRDFHLRQFLAGLTGNALAAGGETVLEIIQKKAYAVITDRNTYYGPEDSEPVVTVGDTLETGDFIFDACRQTAFEGGEVPDWLLELELPASLTNNLGNVLIPAGVHTLTTMTASTGEKYVAGQAIGSAQALEHFWLGIQKDMPLKDPLAAEPGTLDVLSFLAMRWLRYGVSVSLLKSSAVSEELCGMIDLYREIVPPWVMHVIQFDGPTPDCRLTPNDCSHQL